MKDLRTSELWITFTCVLYTNKTLQARNLLFFITHIKIDAQKVLDAEKHSLPAKLLVWENKYGCKLILP